MAIRPIKSISKSGDHSFLKLFKSCREVDLCNLFSNLLVASLEHLIMFCRGQGLVEYFSYVMSLIPQASHDDFRLNYSDVFEDFEELFEKKQLRVLNSMIFDDSFLSFVINLQEMFETRDSKSSHNEKLQLIEFYAVSLKINVLVLMDKTRKEKFYVDDAFVSLTLFDDGHSLFLLFPYEYRDYSSGVEEVFAIPEEEDMRKNLHVEVENQDPLTQKIQSPGLSQRSPRANLVSPTNNRNSLGRVSSPSSVQLEDTEFQKRMAQRARNFKEKRKNDIEKSPRLDSGDFSVLSRNLSADVFFQSRFRDSIIDDSKLMNFKGDITLDSKERLKWFRETELLKQEMLRREEIRNFEEKLQQEESKIKEVRRKEIENLIQTVRNQVQSKRQSEEKRLQDHRKLLQLAREKAYKNSLDQTWKSREELNLLKNAEAERLLAEKTLAEQKILEAQAKLEEAAKTFQNLISLEELRLAQEHEKRMQEEKIIAERLRQEEELKEKLRLEEELKAFELEQQKKLEEEAENERKRLEEEKKLAELQEQLAYEEELRRAEEEKTLQEKLQAEEAERIEKERIAEEERIEKERIAEEEKANKERLRVQKLQEEKKKRVREEEDYMRNLKEKEAEKKRIADEKKAEAARKAEEKRLADEQKQLIEEQKRLENLKKEEARKKKEEEDRRKKEDEEKKRKAEKAKQEEEERKRKAKQEEEKKAAKVQQPEETYEETENTSFCGGLYCAKCARELKRSNYLLKCDSCNDKYLKTGVASISPASSVPQCKNCMNCGAKITKGEEVQCLRCFIQSKIFGESFSPCTGCVRVDKCYWIDAGDAEERNMTLCGFCDDKKAKDAVIVVCSNCEDLICLVCLRKNPFVIQGICSHCHNRRVPRLM